MQMSTKGGTVYFYPSANVGNVEQRTETPQQNKLNEELTLVVFLFKKEKHYLLFQCSKTQFLEENLFSVFL